MTSVPKNKTVRVHVDPEIPQNLINCTRLRDVMRSDLRKIQDKKPDVAKVEKF